MFSVPPPVYPRPSRALIFPRQLLLLSAIHLGTPSSRSDRRVPIRLFVSTQSQEPGVKKLVSSPPFASPLPPSPPPLRPITPRNSSSRTFGRCQASVSGAGQSGLQHGGRGGRTGRGGAGEDAQEVDDEEQQRRALD